MAPGKPRPQSGQTNVGMRLQQLQFSSACTPHQYTNSSLLREMWDAKSVCQRAPASYHRILSQQPLPSTAMDLAARATTLQGPSFEASLRRAATLEHIRSWQSFAADHTSSETRRRRFCPRVQAEGETKESSNDKMGQPGKSDGPEASRPLKRALTSSGSMFERLGLIRLSFRQDQNTGQHDSGKQPSVPAPEMPKADRPLKSKLIKWKEKIEAKSKQEYLRYHLPQSATLVASDQSARAARNSLVLIDLHEEDDRTRMKLRHRVWDLLKREGAIPEERKAQARAALVADDRATIQKIISDAEKRMERAKNKMILLRNLKMAGRTPSGSTVRTDRSASISTEGDPVLSFPGQQPTYDNLHSISLSGHGNKLLRPSTARPSSAQRTCVRERPLTARHDVVSLSEGSPTEGDMVASSSFGTPFRPEQVCRSRSGSPFVLDKDANCDENDSSHEGDLDTVASDPGERKLSTSFKLKLKSEKQVQIERWQRLADLEEKEEKVSIASNRIDMPNHRLDAVPEYFLESDLKVMSVNFRKNSIQTLPDKFCNMPHLVVCDFSHNMLTSLPQTIRYLCNLEKLLLNENRLIGLPFGLGSLQKLQVLNIEKNNITRLPCSLSESKSLVSLFTRGNPPFLSPPQPVMDQLFTRSASGQQVQSADMMERIRVYLHKVLERGMKSRDEVWVALDAKQMSVSALLMAIVGPDIGPEWMVKDAGRPRDLTFSKEHMQEKMRWELKVISSNRAFNELWEFLDENGNGQLTHRQFLYQMKKPMQDHGVAVSVEVGEVVVGQLKDKLLL